MEQEKLSVCYFPTTVMFVDDNHNFLTTLSLTLDSDNIIPKLFFDPLSAMHFLNAEYKANSFTNRCLLQKKDEFTAHQNIEINLQAIHQEIYNPVRYDEISVIVVDYAMPSVNGLDFARQIKANNENYKILMLTGEADETVAVKAFNEGVIDQFISKGAPNFHQFTNSSIRLLQHHYFQNLSSPIVNSISTNKLSLPYFEDPVFIKLFNQICQENNITEYYLTDNHGSFLLLNFDGKAIWLAVRDEEGMEDGYQLANLFSQTFPKSLLTDLQKREKILASFQNNLQKNDTQRIENYVCPAHKLEGNTLYYYSLIKDLKNYPIHPERIFSCRTHLDEIPL